MFLLGINHILQLVLRKTCMACCKLVCLHLHGDCKKYLLIMFASILALRQYLNLKIYLFSIVRICVSLLI